jgi:hypothetical protein
MTFRVKGVPRNWDRDRLQLTLAKEDTAAVPNVKSFATDIDGISCTATVTFQNTPHQLKSEHHWEIRLPSSFETRQRVIVLDDSFLGITTLHAPPSEAHEAEYVVYS